MHEHYAHAGRTSRNPKKIQKDGLEDAMESNNPTPIPTELSLSNIIHTASTVVKRNTLAKYQSATNTNL